MKPDIIDQLFARYYNEALLYTISLCKNKTIAEDIVSNAFYKALASSDDEIMNFKAWLLTVCRNEFFTLCKRNSRYSDEGIAEDVADDSEGVIENIIRAEEYKALYKAIGLLNKEQKECITLFYFSGISVRDIASITGKTEANVKVLLHRGRTKLKEIMENNYEF